MGRRAAAVCVDGEDFGAALRADDGGVPEEAGKAPPDGGVFLLGISQHGQQGGAAFGGEGQRGGEGFGETGFVFLIQSDGDQVGKVAFHEGRLVALWAGKENDAGRLVFHEAADAGALLGGELVGADSDIAKENDVEFGKLLKCFRKFLDVVHAFGRAEFRTEEEAGKLYSRIALECVSEESELPAGEGFHDEDADFFRTASDGKFVGVVCGDKLAVLYRDGEIESGGAFFFQAPKDGVVGFGIGREDDVFRALAAGLVAQADDGAHLPVQRGADSERDLHVFPDDPVCGCGDREQIEIRKPRLAAHRDGEKRDSAQPVFLCGTYRRGAHVEIAIAQKDDSPEVVFLFQEIGKWRIEIRAGKPFCRRSCERACDKVVCPAITQGCPEIGGEGFLHPLRTGDDFVRLV